MIPKILHQTWKNDNIPKEWLPLVRKNRELHPDWDYRLWTDADNLEFVREEFPQLLDLFSAYPKGVMRADVIRYMIMFRIGGVYLDLDYEFIRPFDLNQHSLVLPQNASVEREGFFRIGNCIFGSCPGHEYWQAVFQDLLAVGLPNQPDFDVEEYTGPGMMTRVFHGLDREAFEVHEQADRIAAGPDALSTIFKPTVRAFHPKTPRNQREQSRIQLDKTTYGIHHCAGTWRDQPSVIERIKRRVGRVLSR